VINQAGYRPIVVEDLRCGEDNVGGDGEAPQRVEHRPGRFTGIERGWDDDEEVDIAVAACMVARPRAEQDDL
jgi:hypothetical protein